MCPLNLLKEFLEDHGFLIETSKITSIIDPSASYTLEYVDMIMSIRSHGWQVRPGLSWATVDELS